MVRIYLGFFVLFALANFVALDRLQTVAWEALFDALAGAADVDDHGAL